MQPVILHQVLHGYKDGHRALASSVELDVQDKKTLLILSDISGPGSRLETSGYLTGYPLPNAGLYAFARTWSAPEMTRPGCVWTHTLLIDFADLATVGDTTQLLTCFRRPEGSHFSDYNNAMKFEERSQPSPVSEEVASKSKTLMAGLYQFPSEPIISFAQDSNTAEEAVLAIWGQQWPRLRRSFRFCTLASSDRSTKGSTFDLQLLPTNMPSVKGRFTNVIEAKVPVPEPDWLAVAVNGITATGTDGLHQFLFQAGSDIPNGRADFATLCRVFTFLDGAEKGTRELEAAIELIPESSGALGSSALTRIVARSLFDRGGHLSKKVLSFLADHLEFLDAEPSDDRTKNFGLGLLKSQPKLFEKMSFSGDLGSSVAQVTFKKATAKDIVAAAKKVSLILSHAIGARPELLNEPEIWAKVDVQDPTIGDCLSHLKQRAPALRAAIIAGRHDLLDMLVEESSRSDVFNAYYEVREQLGHCQCSLDHWITDVGKPEVVAEFLSSQRPIDWKFIVLLSSYYEPEEVPYSAVSDPWLSVIKTGHGKLSSEDEIHLHAYLLARALADESLNAAELAGHCFEVTDRAAAHSQLSSRSWIQLERYLPRAAFWRDWDKCYRIRKGVVDRCIKDHWPTDVFLNLTADDEVFAALVRHSKRNYRSRQYLKDVKRDLRKDDCATNEKRRLIIKNILKGY